MNAHPITFNSGDAILAGEVLLPVGAGPHPAVLLIGGTISDTRDGDPALSLTGQMPQHGMLRVMAQHLAGAGVASLRWDKRGVGQSSGGDREWHSDLFTDVDDAHRALDALRTANDIDPQRVAVLGESAGGHIACLLSARLPAAEQPAAYVMQGALFTSIEDMIAWNYQRAADYAARGPEQAAWIQQAAPRAHLLGLHWRNMVDAAKRGDLIYESGSGETYMRRNLRRWTQEMDYAPDAQFRHLQKPVLVIQGDRDLNVPPEDCKHIARTLSESGNDHVTLVVVPEADHSMQLAPDDDETRLRERISFESFHRPYSAFFLHALAGWLLDKLGIK
jgi:hypothetical protein